LETLIEGYAREAGVRNLEKQLGRIVRKGVVKLLKEVEVPLHIDIDTLQDYLGKPVFQKETPMTGVGVVTGLAWTALGGDTLDVEATRVHTKSRGSDLYPGARAFAKVPRRTGERYPTPAPGVARIRYGN
jgi:ATP-dependent Lon protease